MRLIFIWMILLGTSAAFAQPAEEEVLNIRMLALNKPAGAAQKFNEEISQIATDYKLTFIDDQAKPTIRYVYKSEKNETLRMDYRYVMEGGDPETKIPKRPIVVYQKISGELGVITAIYNFLFSAHLTGDVIMSATTTGSSINYMGKTYQFIFQADDYNPGYWVMTFVR